MKIRNGFVSNSSSSSFIIGIAIVADLDTCKKYIAENNIKTEGYDDPKLVQLKDINMNQSYDIEEITSKEIIIESFNDARVSINIENLDEEDYIFYYHYTGDEGDPRFYAGDMDWCDLDYEIDYDFFSGTEKKVIDMFFDPDVAGLNKAECESTFGAGRNG